ncbi:hypothetical protein Tco_0863535 [Tanacetum coccineum]
MVSRFDRMDFLELHSLVMQRFETTTPEGIDLILWGDLKTMFEVNAVDELWKNQEDWILKSWNLYENCGSYLMLEECFYCWLKILLLVEDFAAAEVLKSLLQVYSTLLYSDKDEIE